MSKDKSFKKQKKGIIFVISGPSGVGKSSICRKLLAHDRKILFSVSHTTRVLRKGEKNSKDYWFIDEKTFKKELKKQSFIEWACVHGNYYGTHKKWIENQLKKGFDVLLDIDVQGVQNLKKISTNAIYIFVMPPSKAELQRRIVKRKTETKNTIKQRLEAALHEMQYAYLYDYIVYNDILDTAVNKLKSIVIAERCKNKQPSACAT